MDYIEIWIILKLNEHLLTWPLLNWRSIKLGGIEFSPKVPHLFLQSKKQRININQPSSAFPSTFRYEDNQTYHCPSPSKRTTPLV